MSTPKVRFKRRVSYRLPNGDSITFEEGDVYTVVNSFVIGGTSVTIIHKSMSMGVVVMTDDLEDINEQN